MSDDQKYNGWTNYETWDVALWLDNEQGSYNYWNDRAQEIYDESEADNVFTREQQATLSLSKELEEQHEEASAALAVTGVFADLLTAALGSVNWYEIAEHYIAEVDKQAAEEEEEIES